MIAHEEAKLDHESQFMALNSIATKALTHWVVGSEKSIKILLLFILRPAQLWFRFGLDAQFEAKLEEDKAVANLGLKI